MKNIKFVGNQNNTKLKTLLMKGRRWTSSFNKEF